MFENVIRTNLNGAFFTVNSAAPLLNDNGSIIFNGSVHNYLGQPGVAAYAATKGGLVSMARSIAADLAPRNIRVNVVAPGRNQDSATATQPRRERNKKSFLKELSGGKATVAFVLRGITSERRGRWPPPR